MTNIKTILFVVSLLSLVAGFFYHHSNTITEDKREKKAQLEVFPSDEGWGYQIVKGKKRLIYQPTIPAIDTIMAFPDKASARKIGTLVLKRFNAGHDFSVSKDEVKELIRWPK